MLKARGLIFSTLLLLFIIITPGCTSIGALEITNLNVPLNDLQRICIAVLPIGKRFESVNGREYQSEYFHTTEGELKKAEGMAVRTFVQITILGDRRPYKIEVRAPVQRRVQSGQYELVKYDEGMAKVVSRRIQSALHKRRDDRNIIDEFRVF